MPRVRLHGVEVDGKACGEQSGGSSEGGDDGMVGVGVQSGGSESGRRFRQIHVSLNRACKRHCSGPYGPDLVAIDLVLRVSEGTVDFGFEGLDAFEYSKEERSATVDLGFPEATWRGRVDEDLRAFVVDRVAEAAVYCADMAAKRGASVDRDRVIADMELVRSDVMADPANKGPLIQDLKARLTTILGPPGDENEYATVWSIRGFEVALQRDHGPYLWVAERWWCGDEAARGLNLKRYQAGQARTRHLPPMAPTLGVDHAACRIEVVPDRLADLATCIRASAAAASVAL